MNITDIAFYLLILVGASWLLWELIPDGLKEYWEYQRQVRKDHKKGLKGKYSFTWSNGRGR